MAAVDPLLLVKLILLVALFLFLPLTALTYYVFRRHRRRCEIERIFSVLNIDVPYRKAFEEGQPGRYFLGAVTYTSLIAGIGLVLLFLGRDFGLTEFPSVMWREVEFPQEGSALVCGMAFLGAYLWGMQYIYRRYTQNDLVPAVYYAFSMRMVLATVTALVLYNAAGALAGGDSGGGITANIWPALALLIGMFPQRGLDWLNERIPLFASKNDPSVRAAPLEMIEGVTIEDRIRLQEVGIDTCYDLATADFVPLILKTPYGARELVDWILQAKLCVCFGAAVKELREHSVRTVVELARLKPAEIEMLATDTTLTRSALQRARESVDIDPEIKRLQNVSQQLGKFVGNPKRTVVPLEGVEVS
jgi:hypothetical protein